jgi:hypothetical protein
MIGLIRAVFLAIDNWFKSGARFEAEITLLTSEGAAGVRYAYSEWIRSKHTCCASIGSALFMRPLSFMRAGV